MKRPPLSFYPTEPFNTGIPSRDVKSGMCLVVLFGRTEHAKVNTFLCRWPYRTIQRRAKKLVIFALVEDWKLRPKRTGGGGKIQGNGIPNPIVPPPK
jgi:hypothetical protein